MSGYSGIGKTSLVLQLRQPTIERGGFFISGKFDTLRQAKPLSAVAQALDAFCDDLALSQHARSDRFNATREAISDAIGDGAKVLARLIPNLCKVVESSTLRNSSISEASEIDTKALNRLMYLFRRLFSAIATPTHPVILFIDDLQWADAMSLDLIREIVCSSDMQSFMFIGSYRSNEVDQDHPLLAQMSQIQGAGVPLLNIELSSMSKISINALVSDTLKLSPLLTRPLSDAVYSKTSGNCLFVVELLADLHSQNLLRYSISSRRWEWDDDAVVALGIKSNVVDLMRRKLLRLGAAEMWSVKVAACLGAQTQALTLELLSQGLGLAVENGLAALLHRPVDEGLLMKVGSTYRFSHDQIQQAAYSLVSTSDRPSFHLQLGRSLIKGAIVEGLDGDILFTCVDQFNRGSAEMNDHSEKLFSAQLNLQAARSAIASSTFLAASIYLRFARAYLEENDWQGNYHLCLDIYTSLSETEYVTGEYEEMTINLNQVLSCTKTLDDKLPAYYTLIRASAAQNDLNMAVKTCFGVLEELGESFEDDVDVSLIMKECSMIKAMLEGKDKDWFMNHTVMTDRHKLNLMKFLNLNFPYLYYSNPLKLPLLVRRMIRLTIEHGICKFSATAFSAFGMFCCGFLGDYAEGYWVGKMATAIVKKFGARDLITRVNSALCAGINVWTEPLQSTLLIANAGYKAGIASGDPEYAMLCKQVHTMTSFQCGQPLDGIIPILNELGNECKQYRMELITTLVVPLWQGILNLMGTSAFGNDPTLLDGDVLQGDAFLESQSGSNRKGNYRSAICQYYYVRLVLAYTFGRDEIAAEMYDKCLEAELDKNLLARTTICGCAFFGALTALSMQRKEPNNSKWSNIVDSVMPRMEKWTSASAWNCQHKLSFLKAEQKANSGDQHGAANAYEEAVAQAREHAFVNEEALICERYGHFLKTIGDMLSAKYQYQNAYEAY